MSALSERGLSRIAVTLGDPRGIGPEIVRKALVMYVRFRLSERKFGNLQAEPAIDIIHETVGP